jgi:hypothetical protein
MNSNYSNDPQSIGKYFSNTNVLITTQNRLHTVDPFAKHDILPPGVVDNEPDIMTVKPRSSVPDQLHQFGTKISKSCNLPGITINRFENPHSDVQNPGNIIIDEQFRGGMPSRIVTKDNYVAQNKNKL